MADFHLRITSRYAFIQMKVATMDPKPKTKPAQSKITLACKGLDESICNAQPGDEIEIHATVTITANDGTTISGTVDDAMAMDMMGEDEPTKAKEAADEASGETE